MIPSAICGSMRSVRDVVLPRLAHAAPHLIDQATSRRIPSSRGQNVSPVGSRRWPPAEKREEGQFSLLAYPETQFFFMCVSLSSLVTLRPPTWCGLYTGPRGPHQRWEPTIENNVQAHFYLSEAQGCTFSSLSSFKGFLLFFATADL